MPRLIKHADGSTSAYASVKLNAYSRRMIAKGKSYGMSGELLEGWEEIAHAYELLTHNFDGMYKGWLTDDELAELEDLEGTVHFFLTDSEYLGLSEDDAVYKDLMPKRGKLENLMRRTELWGPGNPEWDAIANTEMEH